MKKWMCLILMVCLFLGGGSAAWAMDISFDDKWEALYTRGELEDLLISNAISQPGDIIEMIAMDQAEGPGGENLMVILAAYGSYALDKRGAMLVYNVDTGDLMDLGQGIVQGDLPLGKGHVGDVSVSPPMLFWLGGNDEASDPSADETLYVTNNGESYEPVPVPGAYAMDSDEGDVVVLGTVGITSQMYVQHFSEAENGDPMTFQVEGDYTMSDMVYWDRAAREVLLSGYENRLVQLDLTGDGPTVSYREIGGLPSGMTAGYLDRIARTDQGQLAFEGDGDIRLGLLDDDMNIVWYLEDGGDDPYIRDIAAVGDWFYICGDDGLYRTEMETGTTPVAEKSAGRPRALVRARIYKGTMWAEMEQFGQLQRENNGRMEYWIPVRGDVEKIILFLPQARIEACLGDMAGDAVILWKGQEIRVPMSSLDAAAFLDGMNGFEALGVELRLHWMGDRWQVQADFRGMETLGSGVSRVHRVPLVR
jgi:hypothetical protein